jgi:zinc protease
MMELITTKMKILIITTIIVAVGVVACVALARFFLRTRTSVPPQSPFSLEIPHKNIHHETLSNGMQVLIFRNTSQPKVLLQIAYDVGSYVENSGECGLAHMLEHMIFKGTQALSESDIVSIAHKYGATFNAFTAYDVTSYHFEANANNWKPFVPILADCMQNARFDAQHLASEVKTVIQELKMRKDNYWTSMYDKACQLIFPSNHPYHTPVIGFKEDLLSLDANNLKQFYKKYYRPDRATLFVVGDVAVDDVMPLVRKHFEPLKADVESIVKTFPTVVSDLVTQHTRYFEDIQKEQLGFYWLIPGLRAPDELLSSALETLLGGGQAGRLVRLLVDEQKIAASVMVKAAKFMEGGLFLIFIEPMPGKAELCEQAIRTELSRLIAHGVDAADVERVAKQKAVSFVHKMQNFGEFTYSWIKSYFTTKDPIDIFKRAMRYFDLTTEQMQTYVKTYLDPFLMNRIEVLPLPVAEKGRREAIKRTSDELDKKILARYERTSAIEEPSQALQLAPPAPLIFTFPKPERVIDLPNGLRVVMAPVRHVPLVAMDCYFKDAFFLDDARDGFGVHLMMEMLIEGSEGFSKKDNVNFFEQCGAAYAFDKGGARVVCLSPDFQPLAERFLHIMCQPTFPNDALAKLKHIFIDGFQRAKDSPRAMAQRLLKNELYKGHAFAWTYDEASAVIKACTSSIITTLHKRYVNPANMVVSVVGDFDGQHMEHFLTDLFSAWPSGTRQECTPVPYAAQKTVNIDYEMLRDQVVLLLGKSSPVTIYDPDLIPLKMLSISCFRSLGSRIYKLREQSGLFYSAFGGFAVNVAKDHGFDFVGTILSPDKVAIVEQQIRTLLETVAKGGMTQQELDDAQQIYLKDLIDLIDDNSTIAHILAALDALGLGFDYYDKVLARIQKMELGELNAIAAKYAMTDGLVRVRVGPKLG